MPIETNSSASAPFSSSSLPTCGPTNSTRCSFTPAIEPASSSAMHLFGKLGAGHALLDRQPDQHVAARCRSSAPLASVKPSRAIASRIWLEVGGLLVVDLHHRAAGEIDAEMQAP